MITVNLRPNLKRKRARSPLAGFGESFRGLGGRVKDPLLLVAVLSWVGVAGFLGYVFASTTRATFASFAPSDSPPSGTTRRA